MGAREVNPELRSVPEPLLKGWQTAIDALAQLLAVPAVVIRRAHADALLISNAGAARAAHTCLEIPLLFPDGRAFGSLCVLDRQPRTFSDGLRHLVQGMRELIEGQLALLPAESEISHSTRLRRSTELLQAVIDGATDAIFLKDTEGRFLIFNRAAATFTARRSADVVGKTAEFVFGPDAARILRERELTVLNSGVATTVEETIVADGQVRTFLTTRSVQRDEAGKIIGLIGIARNISAMKHAEAALHDSEARWQFAVDSAGDGIWDWNVTTGKVFFSHQCKAKLGYADDEFGNSMQDWTEKIHPADLPAAWQSIQDHLAGTTSDFAAEQRMRTRVGAWRWIMVRGKVIERGAGNVAVRVIATQTDITAHKLAEAELKRSYEALRQAADALRATRDEAQSAERAKGEFLATMSHEFRTPMNTVIGMTRLALATELTVRQRNYLEKVDIAARSLLNIINDVLDISKIEAGGLTLEDTEFNLDTVFDTVSNMTAMRAEEKGLEMIFAVAADVPPTLRGDPMRLGQILINLLSNAVKFTHSGEVLVSVRAQAQGQRRVTLQFSVVDTGIGLESDQIKGLFRAFTQLGPHISRKYGGTGLGLAISRQLVELMGGRIWAEGEAGRGSSFHFSIDAALPRDSQTAATFAVRRQMQPRRVLIVDDNRHAREVLSDILRSIGLLPTAVDSGERALAELSTAAREAHGYDLALIDWRMPGVDGIETAQRLRAQSALASLPTVLMVTAYASEKVLQSAEQLNLAGVLIKPVTRSIVFNTLSKIFNKKPAAEGEARVSDAATTARSLRIPHGAAQTLAGRRVLVVDDNGLNREVVTDLLLAVNMLVDSAADGLEAVHMVAHATYEAVLMDIHMPGMDGLSATRQIRSQPHSAKLPIIALTAQAAQQERAAILAAGMNSHLTKPIDDAVLYAALLQVLAPAKMTTYSLKRLGSDQNRLRKLLGDFLRDTAETPETLIRHVEANELEQAAAVVHFIRGAAFYMEATSLCEVAGRFELAARQADLTTARATVGEFNAQLAPLRDYLTAQLHLSEPAG